MLGSTRAALEKYGGVEMAFALPPQSSVTLGEKAADFIRRIKTSKPHLNCKVFRFDLWC